MIQGPDIFKEMCRRTVLTREGDGLGVEGRWAVVSEGAKYGGSIEAAGQPGGDVRGEAAGVGCGDRTPLGWMPEELGG